MKKKLASVVTCTLLAPMLLNGNTNYVYAENLSKPIHATQKKEEKELDRKGLIGYYFKGENFDNLTIFAPTLDNTLMYDQQTANSILDEKQQEYQSIRWIGLIKSKETGDFTFQLSDDEHAIIEIDGEIISQRGKNKQVIHLEKNKLIPIKIEYQSDTPLGVDDKTVKELKLFKVNQQNESHPVELDELRNAEFNKKDTKEFLKKSAEMNLFQDRIATEEDDSVDTDGDSIPDLWEENGYTIHKKLAVKWDDSLASKGYTKFISNPLESHTAGDPYTDYEKAARDMPLANAKETFNPLVAAYPIINVSMEKVILSPNENLSNSVESHSSTNWSYTNSEGASVDVGFKKMFSFGVSANYQHTETVAHEWGESTGNTSGINTASAGYLNANVRYNNVGTGAIYNVKPTTSFVLDDNTIATITAKSNSTALSISPGDSYPEKRHNGIAITSMDDFNSHPITLNKQQLDQVLNNHPIMLQTSQTEGEYKTKDTNGNIVTGGEWNGYIQEIQRKTASIIVDTGEAVSEKRIAAKDYDYPEDGTPSLSLKEALKLGYPEEIEEEDGLLYYNDKPIYEESVMTFLDEKTAQEVEKQLEDTNGKFKDVKQLYDVKLTPEMNFTIKLASLYDGAEETSIITGKVADKIMKGVSNPLGIWYVYPNVKVVEGGITGRNQYQVSTLHLEGEDLTGGLLKLSAEAKKKLKKNYKYYLSMYVRTDVADAEVTVGAEGRRGKGTSGVGGESTVEINGNYQRVNVLINNPKSDPITSVYVDSTNNIKIYIDDVTITEVAAMDLTKNK